MIRVWLTGRHAHRTPLSYPGLSPELEAGIRRVDRPSDADLYVIGHVDGIREAPPEMVEDWRARRVPVVLLSEEPFWDTIWGKRPLDPVIVEESPWGDLPVHQVSHQTSGIFRFERIPYYLLTTPNYIAAYRGRFARNAALSPEDWREAFAARPLDLSFMFERRPEGFHDAAWPGADLAGLCAWRTELAEACDWEGVERLGRSWGTQEQSRFVLEDWHADKLARLDGRARLMGALENTHQPDYLTEKLFDAFACGSVPLYRASPDHRLHRLGLPEGSWLNLQGLSPEEAAAQLVRWRPEAGTFEAFAGAQRQLRDLFHDDTALAAERSRIGTAVLDALKALL